MERLTKRNTANTAYYYPHCFKDETCMGSGISERCESCEFTDKICQKLGEYEDAEERGLLLRLPCKVGDTVFVLAACERIPAQLDGTLHDENGGSGTATGYYCPYEDNCPYADCQDCEDCNECKSETAVFEDEVCTIWIEECKMHIETKNCGICSVLGKLIFLTKEAAEQALAEMKEV